MAGENKKLYKPAEFAKTVGTTKRALRHYHETGILVPSIKNEAGYRFYSSDDFFEAQRVLTLRFLGFSLDEIGDIQKTGKGIKESLKMQRFALQERVDRIQTIIKAISDMEKAMEQAEEIDWDDLFNAVKLTKYEMVREKMMEYYDERAGEYDEIYEGKGPASLSPEYYSIDLRGIEAFMKGFGNGRIIDIACGSGYWVKYYQPKCSSFTFLDQSEKMIEECRKKTDLLGITAKSTFIRSDILDYEFDENDKFDCAIIGFLLGHFTKKQDAIFFRKLKTILKPGAEVLIIDSTWNRERAKKQNKEDIAERRLNDGRTFKIYKKYFDRDDLSLLLNSHGITVRDRFFGHTFTAVIGVI